MTKHIELTGTVLLDSQSESRLRAEIREQVIQQIKESGNYVDEIVTYLTSCNY